MDVTYIIFSFKGTFGSTTVVYIVFLTILAYNYLVINKLIDQRKMHSN